MRISDWSSDVCSSDLVRAKSKSEIDQLADFTVDWEEVRGAGRGRPVIAVKLSFNPKDMVDQEMTAQELDRPKVGRRARREGTVDAIVGALPPSLQGRGPFPEGSLHYGADPRITSIRSEEHTSELQSLMRISYAVSCLK